MSSPVFTHNDSFSPVPRNSLPVTNGSIMTMENTIQKIVFSFVVLLATAGIGWFLPVLLLPALLVGLVLGLVNSFKKEPSPPLILIYSAAEGLVVGGFSSVLEGLYPGIAVQAVMATFVVIGVTLTLFASGKIRESAKATKIFMIALISYLAFSVLNLILMATNVTSNPWGLRGEIHILGIPLGLILGVLAVVMGAYSLVMDFTFIQNGVRNELPEKYGWTGAFGIVVTVVWLYLEIIRMFAISRN
jgi:uncharacterized YccA/Bax inhibitor family protein